MRNLDTDAMGRRMNVAHAKSGLSDKAFVDYIFANRNNVCSREDTEEYTSFFVANGGTMIQFYKWWNGAWHCKY